MTIQELEELIDRCRIRLDDRFPGKPRLAWQGGDPHDQMLITVHAEGLTTLLLHRLEAGEDVLVSTSEGSEDEFEPSDEAPDLKVLERITELTEQLEKAANPLLSEIGRLQRANPMAAAYFEVNRLEKSPDKEARAIGRWGREDLERLTHEGDPAAVLEKVKARFLAYLLTGGWRVYSDPVTLPGLGANPDLVDEYLDSPWLGEDDEDL